MKPTLLFLGGLFIVACTMALPTPVSAQAAENASARLSFLSEADRTHYLQVREQALTKNPGLQQEQDSLTKEREALKNEGTSATADERKTLFENMMAHGKSMRAAMLQIDPSISPVLDQVDAKMKERFKQRAAQAGTGNG